MMWWAIWCAVVVAGSACAEAAPSSSALAPAIDWAQIESSAPDDDSLGYAVPPMGGRYAADSPWLYLLAEVPRDSQGQNERLKRRMPMLSIDMPMSVLRHKLSLEKERKITAQRALANRNFLNDIGKRGFINLADLREGRPRPKRKMPSLSINNPMEVLRQRLLLEVARKQMREANQRQAVANRVFLQNVGKRGFWSNSAPSRYDN
ncbi:unnamed protein product, partial [Brenthis ino]